MGSTHDRQVPDEDWRRPSPSPQEQAREGGVKLVEADHRDLVREGTTRRARGAVMRRLMGDYDY